VRRPALREVGAGDDACPGRCDAPIELQADVGGHIRQTGHHTADRREAAGRHPRLRGRPFDEVQRVARSVIAGIQTWVIAEVGAARAGQVEDPLLPHMPQRTTTSLVVTATGPAQRPSPAGRHPTLGASPRPPPAAPASRTRTSTRGGRRAVPELQANVGGDIGRTGQSSASRGEAPDRHPRQPQ
jgi:hypothetical protein